MYTSGPCGFSFTDGVIVEYFHLHLLMKVLEENPIGIGAMDVWIIDIGVGVEIPY